MVSGIVLANERDEVLAEVEELLAGLESVDSEELEEMGKRAGSTSVGMPSRPKLEDLVGCAYYNSNIMLLLARAITHQQERISELEAQLGAAAPPTPLKESKKGRNK